MKQYEPDYLDEVVALRAKTDPGLASEWAASTLLHQLRQLREERGVTQAQLAERMGLAQPHVARLERRPWAASFARILAYADALGVDLATHVREEVAA